MQNRFCILNGIREQLPAEVKQLSLEEQDAYIQKSFKDFYKRRREQALAMQQHAIFKVSNLFFFPISISFQENRPRKLQTQTPRPSHPPTIFFQPHILERITR